MYYHCFYLRKYGTPETALKVRYDWNIRSTACPDVRKAHRFRSQEKQPPANERGPVSRHRRSKGTALGADSSKYCLSDRRLDNAAILLLRTQATTTTTTTGALQVPDTAIFLCLRWNNEQRLTDWLAAAGSAVMLRVCAGKKKKQLAIRRAPRALLVLQIFLKSLFEWQRRHCTRDN